MSRDTRLSDVVHVLLHMSQMDAPLTSTALARGMGTNSAVLRRTMAGLRQAGLVRSAAGRGGGWRLARPLDRITLLDVYDALGRPTLFAFGNRSEQVQCPLEGSVNAVIADTMAEAALLLRRRFGELPLDRIAVNLPTTLATHADV